MSPWLAGLLFVVAVAVDVLWVVYTQAVTAKRAALAANAGIAIYALGAVSVVSYVNNVWYLAPVIAGSWTGTFFTLKRGRHES